MRIYVFSLRKAIAFVTTAAIIVAFVSFTGFAYSNMLAVFSQARELPIYSVDCTEKKVSITFDCAWGADDIPQILSILKKENIKATFFVVGQWAAKFPETVKAIAGDGHDIANHSFSHLRMGALDNGRIHDEILKCNTAISDITGKKVDLFRAPYGDYNDAVVKEAKRLGCYSIQWDVDSLDWKPGISSKEILSRINSRVKKGSIILFHNDTPNTAGVLPEVISVLKSKGYEFIPVSKLIIKDGYMIDNEGRQKPVGK